MIQPITDISLKFSCPVNWDEMKTTDGGKFCDKCNHPVYDFTNASHEEFLTILAENSNRLCGRFTTQQLAAKPQVFWKKWASAAMLLIGFNIFSNNAAAKQGGVSLKRNITQQPQNIEVLNGIVASPYDVMPEFPGGDKAFAKFMTTHIKYKGKAGKVFAQFNIERNGSLSSIRIVRGVNDATNSEVIRVLKLSPKWKPAKLKGKPIATSYTIPVVFGP